MNKKEVKQSVKVDMRYFLEVYCGITNATLIDKLSKLSHKEISEVANLYGINISRISFDSLTRDMIAMGDVIIVIDSHFNYAPYINPNISFIDEYSTTLSADFISNGKEKII